MRGEIFSVFTATVGIIIFNQIFKNRGKEIKLFMEDVFKTLPYNEKALLAIPAKNEMIEKSASNLPYVKSILVDYLNIKDLLKYKTLVLLKDSLINIDKLTK
mgnify:CR=1 FL=1